MCPSASAGRFGARLTGNEKASPNKRPSRSFKARFKAGTASIGVVSLIFFGLPIACASPSLPSFEAVRAAHQPSSLRVLDRYGEPVAALRTDYTERRGSWVPLQAVSPALRRAVLLSEDRRFHEHRGVDWTAMVAAGWSRLWGTGARGASTVTMQVAAMLDDSLRRPASGRSLRQKWEQLRKAQKLEAAWPKEQILEAYLNLAAFRGELRGVDALSRVMFGKHPHGLDQREAAVAAALLRGPNADPARVAARACALLKESFQIAATQGRGAGNQGLKSAAPEKGSAASCDGVADDARRWLGATAQPAADEPALAPHFSRAVVKRADMPTGAAIATTLDAGLQRIVMDSVSRHLAGMGPAQLTDAAVVVLDNRTAEVLAYVGSSGAASSAAEVDHVAARRQAGSTLKPFLYALALESRYLTAASLLDDAPLDVATSGGLYIPQNYDRGHAGWVTVRSALASSLNIPAVRTLMLVGTERFADRLRRLGLPLVHEADHYGYSLSLGSADVDLLSLTNAYRVLANGGQWSGPVMQPARPVQEQPMLQVVDPMASWIVADMLSDRGARARSFGFESALSTRFWSAVKTGTSKDMRDNWCVGWSERYTVGVWVGNSQGLSMRDVSGVSGAAPIWHDVMSFLHARQPSHQTPPPSGLERQLVAFADDIEAARMEYFLPGTALQRVESADQQASASPRIVSPVSGAIIALDPDMPLDNQRLALRARPGSAASEAVRWRIGKTVIGDGASAWWQPSAGRHRIVLQNAQGQMLDEVTIHVRAVPRR